MSDDFLQASILVVDDDRVSRIGVEEMLKTLGARIVTAASGEEALKRVLEEDFAAILMDVQMPGIDGPTTARMIRERARSRNVPIIFMTAAAQEDVAPMFTSYRAGAVDYMVKPLIPEIVRSKLSFFVGLHDMNRMLSAELAERALTEQRLRASEENLRALASHLQNVREEERVHIAREIHDELGQALTGLKYDIAALMKASAEAPETMPTKAQNCNQAIDRIINAVRRICSGLRPEVLDEIGLAAAVEWQAREFSRRTGIRASVEISPGFTDPDKQRSTAVFRVFQELLTNVARHANATRVNVTLADAETLALKVEDNGRGIQETEFESPRSLGFMGLRERVLAFGGSIDVKGHEGKGTTVSVCIPLTQQQPVFHA